MKQLGRLSDVEMEVMQVIWDSAAPVTVARLLGIFEESKGWKTSTVSTMLERIIQKGFLRKEMKVKVNYYSVIATRDVYQRQEGRNLLSSLYGGSIKNFMAALVHGGDMTAADVEELRAWFAGSMGGDGGVG